MKIDELLKRFPAGDPPFQVNVSEALNTLIGRNRIYRMPFSRGIDGMLVFIQGEPFVLINTAQSKNRIHWTEAHELAEFLLHKDTAYQSVYFSFHKENILAERKVNNLAAEMLMPGSVLKEFFSHIFQLHIQTDNEKLISYLSDYFSVSEEAVKFRLKSLKLI